MTIQISIHAPAKGATKSLTYHIRFPEYFNPRSREGSDGGKHQCLTLTSRFQSTLPRRERLLGYFLLLKCYKISIHAPAKGATGIKATMPMYNAISIHAPAKGATRLGDVVSLTFKDFNPRSREGSDYVWDIFDRYCRRFQSTLPRRERHKQLIHRICIDDFNPRSREGSDTLILSALLLSRYFNPRSREGSDL